MVDVFETHRGGCGGRRGMKKGRQDKILSAEEFSALLAAARADRRVYGTRGYGMFFFAGNFGLRCGEAMDLRKDDFKTLRFGYFTVRTLKKKAQEEDRVYVGRNGLSVVARVLAMFPGGRGAERLFPYTTRTGRHFFAYYADKAALSRNVSFHSLRHCAARRLYGVCKDRGVVNAFLRHKPETTEIYTDPSPEELMAWMDKMGLVV